MPGGGGGLPGIRRGTWDAGVSAAAPGMADADQLVQAITSFRLKTRWLGSRGEDHPRSKLTEDDVRHIRELIALGVGPSQIARRAGVMPSTIIDIRSGRIWGWLV